MESSASASVVRSTVLEALDAAKRAQRSWAEIVPRKRFSAIGRLAARLVQSQRQLLDSIQRPNANDAEKLASEVLPLADACRFTAKTGRQTLAPRSQGARYGSWWMGRVGVSTVREPWGTVLILAPSNYPLFLPGVQAIQAIAAGNAALVKPAENGVAAMNVLGNCLLECGIPENLFQVLPWAIEAGQTAMRAGVDKVVLTGSVKTGKAVLEELKSQVTPVTLELGGCDAVFVLPQAEVGRTAKSIAYALCLNGGCTCIAPRRIFVTPNHHQSLSQAIVQELEQYDTDYAIAPDALEQAVAAVRRAVKDGAAIIFGKLPEEDSGRMQPVVLDNVRPDADVVRSDLFAPITSMINVPDMSAALEADRMCPFGLGASIFGPDNDAQHWASRINAGCIVINDLVVPTADPRVFFGGRDLSGWGGTRGSEGLLAMTRSKSICTRKGNWLPHLDRENANDLHKLEQLFVLFHSNSWRARFHALKSIIQAGPKGDR